jgi:hypothetical protein
MPGPGDPALDHLFRALTADGTADELSRKDAALTMFRDSRRRSRFAFAMFRDGRRRSRRLRFASAMSMAAAALVIIGGIAGAAYAAVLPAPVQHIAYRMLGRIGVPDTHRHSPASSTGRAAAAVPSARPDSTAAACPCPAGSSTAAACPCQAGKSTVSACPCPAGGSTASACPCPAGRSTVSACPCQAGKPTGSAAGQNVVLAVAHARIPVYGDDTFSGRLARRGRPEPGVRAQLFEHVDGWPGWRLAGSAMTDRRGEVTLAVHHLAASALFRLAGPGGAASAAVRVTVVPPVDLRLAPGHVPGTEILTARARFADTGDVVVLQERAGTAWYSIDEDVLDGDHLASFTVLIPRSGGHDYRVVLRRTSAHGSSVSGQVTVSPPLSAARARDVRPVRRPARRRSAGTRG